MLMQRRSTTYKEIKPAIGHKIIKWKARIHNPRDNVKIKSQLRVIKIKQYFPENQSILMKRMKDHCTINSTNKPKGKHRIRSRMSKYNKSTNK